MVKKPALLLSLCLLGCAIGVLVSCITPELITLDDDKTDGEIVLEDGRFYIYSDQLCDGGSMAKYGGKTYSYITRKYKASGNNSMCLVLDYTTWSGISFMCPPLNCSNLDSVSIEFDIRGASGGETFILGIIDGHKDGKEVVARAKSPGIVKVTPEWQHVEFPLWKFGKNGNYWNGYQENVLPMDWSDIIGIRFFIDPKHAQEILYIDNVAFNFNSTITQERLPEVEVIASDTRNDGCYIGVFGEGFHENPDTLKDLEAKMGKRFAMIMWYEDWTAKFNTERCESMWQKGYVPHIVWEAWINWGANPEQLKLRNIDNGEYDSYIRSYARDVAKWGKPVVIRILHEFNGDWYPWSVSLNDFDVDMFIRCYRRIVDIYREEGATNAQFCWSPMNQNWPDTPINQPELAYPGDDYVSWIAPDVYNSGTSGFGSETWDSFDSMFRDVYYICVKNFPNKPIMIGEYACADSGGNKGVWFSNTMWMIENRYPAIKAWVWFNISKEADWRLDSRIENMFWIRNAIRDNYFLVEADGLVTAPMRYDNRRAQSLLNLTKPREVASADREKYKAIARRVTVEPVIDGVRESWFLPDISIKYAGVIDVEDPHSYGADLDLRFGGDSDCSARAAVAYDGENLYIAVKVTDDYPMNNPQQGGNIWMGDGIGIGISLNPDADPKREAYDSKDFQIGFSTGSDDVDPVNWCWQLNGKIPGVEYQVTQTETGYFYEMKIPFKSFGYKPQSGDTIGFEMAIDDADAQGNRENQLQWNGNGQWYRDPSVWGTLTFE